jgi:outer membrane protein TolC
VKKAGAEASALGRRRLPELRVALFENALLGAVDFSFATGVFGDFPQIGPVPGQDTNVRSEKQLNTVVYGRVSQPISQLYKIGLGVRALELGRDAAQEKVTLRKQEVENDVKRLYYGILLAESGVAAADDALALYQELERVVSSYVEQQVVLKSDLLDVQSGRADAERRRLLAFDTAATLKEQLNMLMGRSIDTRFQVVPVPADLEAGPADAAEAEARALTRRPELREAGLRVQQAEHDHRLKVAEYIPDVSASFQYVGFRNVAVLPPNVAAAGILLTWEPFDWGRKAKEAAAKRAVVDQAKTGLKEAESMIRIDIRNRFRKLAEAREELRAAQLNRDSLAEKLRVAKDRYRQQAALTKDVLQAQARFAEGDQRSLEARLAFWTARADLEKALAE